MIAISQHSKQECLLSVLFLLLFLLSCEKANVEIDELRIEEKESMAEVVGRKIVQKRAELIACLQWTPINDVPSNLGVYNAGCTYTGVPYSSTKKINKYVGLDVSFYTFLSAVHNPLSVLYTENINRPPYNGINCASFYGTVCSTAVDFALGIDIPYPSAFFPLLEDFEEVGSTDLNQLKIGDVAHMQGHVFMIYQLHFKGEQVEKVTYLESSGTTTQLITQQSDGFISRIKNSDISFYRYRKIASVNDYYGRENVISGDESLIDIHFNDSLCPNRGDKSVYRVDEEVVIDVFNLNYDNLVIQKEGKTIAEYAVQGATYNLGFLPAGRYSAFLTMNAIQSNTVSFIVAEPIVNVQVSDIVHISFSCEDATPYYCVFTDDVGDFHFIYRFNEIDCKRGFVNLHRLTKRDYYYYKVVFKTEYGTIINNPIKA